MNKNVPDLTREEVRDIFRAQREGYEQMERDRLREVWREPSIEEKDAFDRLMHDVWLIHQQHRAENLEAERYVESDLIAYYRKLLRLPHE